MVIHKIIITDCHTGFTKDNDERVPQEDTISITRRDFLKFMGSNSTLSVLAPYSSPLIAARQPVLKAVAVLWSGQQHGPGRTYKPDPRAYQLGTDTLDLGREEIVFTVFEGWDVAGAKWFGYPTFRANRADLAVEELGISADGTGHGLKPSPQFISARNNA